MPAPPLPACPGAAAPRSEPETAPAADSSVGLLKHRKLDVLGRYRFTATQPAGGTLCPLRDPDTAGLDDDEDGAEN